MHFYHHARVDGLQKRNETPTYMEEHFLERDDFLYFRSIEFAKRPKKFGPADSSNANARPILKMVERYHRNRDKPANEDIAEVIFNISEVRTCTVVCVSIYHLLQLYFALPVRYFRSSNRFVTALFHLPCPSCNSCTIFPLSYTQPYLFHELLHDCTITQI